MGYRVIALSASSEKEAFAKELGASYYIDTLKGDVVNSIKTIIAGQGVALVIETSGNGKLMVLVIEALGVNGTLLSLGASAVPLTVYSGQLIHNNRCIQGWSSGGPQDGEDTLQFAQAFGIKVLTEAFTLNQAGEAYDRMNANTLRFRAVLIPGNKQ